MILWRNWQQIDNEFNDRKEILMMGDFNARVGKKVGDMILVGPHGEDTLNGNGERLFGIRDQFALSITNGFYQHQVIHRKIWFQPAKNVSSIIDYVVVRQKTKIKV